MTDTMSMTRTRNEDVVALLTNQHEEIKALFARVLDAPADQRRGIFEDLVRLLAVHETAEEELVHPLARSKVRGGESVVDARLAEEKAAKQHLSEIYDMGVDSPQFTGRIEALRDAVLAHAEHEEHEEFQQLRRAVDEERLLKLADAVRMAEKTAPTRPHPGAQSATANVALGPPLAIFDRVRDAFRDAGRGD